MKRIISQPTVAFLFICALVFAFYSDILLNPNGHMFTHSGDAIKNYYTLLYHAFYSEGSILLTGMNYPYFEHVVYTDAMPLVSEFIGLVGDPKSSVGLVNFIMMLGIPITAVFIFLILRNYGVNKWWGLFATVSITMIAPQIDRLGSHYGLSFAFLIPCFWWIIINYDHSRKFYWVVIASLLTVASYFLHPYNGLILTATGLVYFGLKTISERENRKTSILSLIVTGVIPALFFQTFMALTDPVDDRYSSVQSFFSFYGRFESLIHPRWPQDLYMYFVNIGMEEQAWEGAAYLGAGTILFILVCSGYHFIKSSDKIMAWIWSQKSILALLIVAIPTIWINSTGVVLLVETVEFILVFGVVRSVLAHFSDAHFNSLQTFIVAASVLMLWGMCIPFKYEPFQPIVSLLGPISEFRSLGRFLWVAYYAFAIGAVVWLHRLYNHHKILASIVFVLGLSISAYEWGSRHTSFSQYLSAWDNSFDASTHPEDFQDLVGFLNEKKPDAMVFLPFYYLWSNANEVMAEMDVIQPSISLSYLTETPLFNMYSARISATHSRNMLELFAPHFVPKEIVDSIPTNANIMVVRMRSKTLPFEQSGILHDQEIVFQNETYTVYHCDLKKLQDDEMIRRIVENAPEPATSVDEVYARLDSSMTVYHRSFEEQPEPMHLFGKGALSIDRKNEWTSVDYLPAENLEKGEYELSFYVSTGEERPDAKAFLTAIYNDGSQKTLIEKFVSESYYSFSNWNRLALRFHFSPDIEGLNLSFHSSEEGGPIYLDELLLREVNDSPLVSQLILSSGQKIYVCNNFWFDAVH